MMKPKIFSFFSGAGFLDLGFELGGFEVVFANEYHPPFFKAYLHARKSLKIAEPALGCSSESVTDFASGGHKSGYLAALVTAAKGDGSLVGFIGGPRCPDFSVGGKNRVGDGENGELSHAYVNLIYEHKPDFFQFENLKYLWRTKRHRALSEGTA